MPLTLASDLGPISCCLGLQLYLDTRWWNMKIRLFLAASMMALKLPCCSEWYSEGILPLNIYLGSCTRLPLLTRKTKTYAIPYIQRTYIHTYISHHYALQSWHHVSRHIDTLFHLWTSRPYLSTSQSRSWMFPPVAASWTRWYSFYMYTMTIC